MSKTPDGREEALTCARGILEDFDLDIGSETTGTFRFDGTRATLRPEELVTEGTRDKDWSADYFASRILPENHGDHSRMHLPHRMAES